MSDEAKTEIDESQNEQENELTTLKKRVEELEEQNADLQDKFLRKHADYENYRKRMVKEKAEAILYANTDLMKAMLEVLDNFDRAEQAALATGDIEAIKEGIAMINKALIEVLSSKGLAKIASTGHEFNPEVHQAIAMVEDEAGTLKKDTVAEEYQAGYTLNERVLRPATVRVTKASNNVD